MLTNFFKPNQSLVLYRYVSLAAAKEENRSTAVAFLLTMSAQIYIRIKSDLTLTNELVSFEGSIS
jgi:hypothetical protein